MPTGKRNKPEAVVLVRFSALGDVAMAIPVVYDLCLARPELTVVFLTRIRFASLAVNPPTNLVVEGVDLDGYRGASGMMRLAARLCSRYSVKAFIDIHDVLRTAILRFFMRIRGVKVSVVDKGRADKRLLVARGAEKYFAEGGRPLPSTIQRYRDAVRLAGFTDVKPLFRSLFGAERNSENEFLIGVAPFAAHRGKVYPVARMEEVVVKLSEMPDTKIFLFGAGKEECSILAEWAHGRPNVVNMASQNVGLPRELELMSLLDVMLAMDSGNMHLAAVAGTPRIVSVWGATHPAAGFVPFRSGNDTNDVVSLDLPCRPCSVYGNRQCRYGDYACLGLLDPEKIISEVIKSGTN